MARQWSSRCLAAAAVLLVAGTATAQDFPPFDVEYADGMTRRNAEPYSRVTLRDSPDPLANPTTVVLDEEFVWNHVGGSYRLYGKSQLYNHGASLSNYYGIMSLYDSSQFIMTGGSISLEIKEMSTIWAQDNAHLEISGGSFIVSNGDDHHGNTLISLRGNATMSISGGRFESRSVGSHLLYADGSSRVDITGGEFLSPLQAGGGQIHFYGRDFAIDGEPISMGRIPRYGVLTGVLANGTPLNISVGWNVFVHPVPEASSWILALAGVSVLRGSRRKAGRMQPLSRRPVATDR
jgi:hypothetical protein